MLTTTTVIKDLILEDLELSQIWNKKILNLTALAKILQPKIEERLQIKTKLSSLIVSLNRLAGTWEVENLIPEIKIKNIQIIRNISTMVYKRTPEVVKEIMIIKDKILENTEVFVTHEIDRQTILFSTEMEELKQFELRLKSIENLRKSYLERLVAVIFELESSFSSKNLTSIESERFVHYAVLRKLAQTNISITRMRSCQNQFLFLVEDKYMDQIYKLWRD